MIGRAATLALAFLCLFAAAAHAGPTLARRSVIGAAFSDSAAGATVTFVQPGGAAASAGLAAGDTLTAIGRTPTKDSAAVVATVRALPADAPVVFAILRGGKPLALSVTPRAAPKEQDQGVLTRYDIVAVDGSLRRTLITLPDGARGRLPALLIIGGIGCFTVDNALDREDAYMRLAHDLARRGIVTMRLEKSGVGDSRGPPCLTTDLNSEMRSYAAALDALRRDQSVAPAHVYLFGHSIGTLIAPRLALSTPVAGVIAADGVGRNWIEYELANLRRQLELEGKPADAVDKEMALKELCMHRLLVARESEATIETTNPECRTYNSYPAPDAYMQQAAALDIAEPWTKLSAPVLAIYGTGDFVTAREDHERIVAIVNKAHPGDATLALVDGMDLHFDVAGTEQQAWELRVRKNQSGPYDEKLSDTVLAWLCKREPCR